MATATGTKTVTLSQDCYFETWLDSRKLDYGHANKGEQVDLLGGRYRTILRSQQEQDDREMLSHFEALGLGDPAEVEAATERLKAAQYGDLYHAWH